MGGTTFDCTAKGKTAKEAFANAKRKACYDHGHAGYSGTIAEKDSFVLIPLPSDKNAGDYAAELINANDPRIDDKWGPAGCIDLKDGSYFFFGWASC